MKKHKKLNKNELPGSKVKISFRKHFLPPLMGLLTMLAVFGLLNSQYIVATISALTYKEPVETVVPEKSPVDPSPRIIINKIGVKAPVIYNQKTIDETAFQLALRDGVVHYPFTARPGETGNTVIFGHSSGQIWAPGNYKFVFTHLEKLEVNDKIFVYYKGVRYIYNVKNKKVVPPTDVSVLMQSDESILTLITCTPVGTSKNRLIITADQIVPKPLNTSDKKPDQLPENITTELPDSRSPSVWQSIRELF